MDQYTTGNTSGFSATSPDPKLVHGHKEDEGVLHRMKEAVERTGEKIKTKAESWGESARNTGSEMKYRVDKNDKL